MFPATAQNHVGNSLTHNAVFFGQLPMCDSAIGVALSYFLHYLCSQSRMTSLFPSRVAAFCNHICQIVRLCAKEQMCRVNAPGDIAVVTYLHAFRDVAIVQHVCNAVCAYSLTIATTIHQAMTRCLSSASPFPTGVSFLDFCPKAMSKRNASIDGIVASPRTVTWCFPSVVREVGLKVDPAAYADAFGFFGRLSAHHDLLRGVMPRASDPRAGASLCSNYSIGMG